MYLLMKSILASITLTTRIQPANEMKSTDLS